MLRKKGTKNHTCIHAHAHIQYFSSKLIHGLALPPLAVCMPGELVTHIYGGSMAVRGKKGKSIIAGVLQKNFFFCSINIRNLFRGETFFKI